MGFIRSVKAMEILDSRGYPTLEVQIKTESLTAKAAVPSGASTGEFEALELRDGDPDRYQGKGVKQAIEHVNGPIAEILIGQHACDQTRLDLKMIAADGTDNKSRYGANAILGASLALARMGSLITNLPLYRYIGGCHACILPCPMVNILNGGAHADNTIDFQEFMIRPIGAPTFSEAIRWSTEIFHALKKILKQEKTSTAVGDEGGFAPNLLSAEEALSLIMKAIEEAGYSPGEQVTIALDCAASELYDPSTHLYVEKKKKLKQPDYAERNTEEQVFYLEELCSKYPIDSIEDGLDQNDWTGWQLLTKRLGSRVQIVGDDLFVTNSQFLCKGIEMKAANAILIKLNQIGTVTETLEAIRIAHNNGFTSIVSHRSGETADTFIADLSVGMNAGQIKTGAPSRGERVVKYNRLIEIEDELGKCARYLDSNQHKVN